MSNTVEELILRISGDSAGGQQALKDLLSPIEALGKSLTGAITDPATAAKTALNDMLTTMGPLGVGLAALTGAATLAGKEIFNLAQQAADTGEAIRVFGLITGTAIEDVSAIAAAATIAGSSLDGMQSMLTQMQRRLDATGPAADKLNAALADLHLNSDAFRAADPSDRIAILAGGMQGAAGSTTLMSDALAIMGRAGVTNIGT